MQEMITVKDVTHLQDSKSIQIHRPFPPPVFDHLQYANMEGEGLQKLRNMNTMQQCMILVILNPSSSLWDAKSLLRSLLNCTISL